MLLPNGEQATDAEEQPLELERFIMDQPIRYRSRYVMDQTIRYLNGENALCLSHLLLQRARFRQPILYRAKGGVRYHTTSRCRTSADVHIFTFIHG